MKIKLYTAIVLIIFYSSQIHAQANTTLSNLVSPTKVNVNLLPDKNGKHDLGSLAKQWRNIYFTGSLYTDSNRVITIDTSHRSTFVGEYTGIYNTGYWNTANGGNALYSNTSGSENTATGYDAMYANTTGGVNTATGRNALYSNTNGNENTATGYNAMYFNTGGYDNTANGYGAMYSNTIGAYNTAIGDHALAGTVESQYNTAVGYNAGGAYNQGYNNVFIGAVTGTNTSNYYNDIAIGKDATCTGPSQVTIGNSSTGQYRAYADWTNISDGRFKKNIKENVPGLEFINKLKPITYTLDATGIDNFLHKDLLQDKQISEKAKAVMSYALAEKERVVYTGFVAQDVEKAAKSLNFDFSGVDAAKNDKDLYGLRYAEFVVPLVKAVQELSSDNDEMKKNYETKINELQNQINELKAMIQHLTGNNQQPIASK